MIHVSLLNINRVGYHRMDVAVSTFKGGEVNVRLPEKMVDYFETLKEHDNLQILVQGHLTNSDLVMAFFMTVDAIRRLDPTARIHAIIPYLPYARQDRVCNPGEANSIAMFGSMLNMLNLASVQLIDAHSDVAGAVIKNSFVNSQRGMLSEILKQKIRGLDTENLMLVAPDSGAIKKVASLAKHVGLPFVTASKLRDTESMEIIQTRLDGKVEGKNLIVVDDICDGGRTFLQLGKLLREAGCKELNLLVSHGIFSYGVDELMKIYDRIYVSNSFHPNPLSELRQYTDNFIDNKNQKRFCWFNT